MEMRDDDGKVTPTGQITGDAVYGYLKNYATKYDLLERMRLSTRVVKASRQNSLWYLELDERNTHPDMSAEPDRCPERATVTCQKLIVATGLTSEPCK